MNRQDKIAELEHDLEKLRCRYANLERAAWRLKVGFYSLVVGLVIALIYRLIALHPGMLFVVIFVGAMAAGSVVWFRNERWIDLVTILGARWAGLRLGNLGIKRTEAEAVEDMVAERLAKLSRLKVE